MSEHNQDYKFIDRISSYEISEQAKLKSNPMVSVLMITYNHESYIAQAIEGVLMQKTDFAIEIVIGEDCSTDRTREIVLDYQKKYPELIRVIISDNNVGMMNNSKRTMAACRGKYMAICEGDDYWTDPYKLQKQVDFLEANEDCTLCFHATKFIYENNPERNFVHRPKKIPANCKFTMKHAILGGGGFMATNSMLFHREYILERPKWMDEAPVGDLPLMLLLASKGKMGFIDDVMSVYRVMTPNSWSSTMRDRQKSKKHHFAILKMCDDFDNWSNKKYHQFVVRKKLKNKLNYLIRSFRNILK